MRASILRKHVNQYLIMPNSLAVTKSQIQIGSKALTVLRLKSGGIAVTCSETAKLLNLDVKTLKTLIAGRSKEISTDCKLVPIEFIDELLLVLAKNKLVALNLVKSLKGVKLAEIAVKVFSSHPVVQSDWLSYRKANQDIHSVFQNNCLSRVFPACHVHDAMTTLVFGQTAKEARIDNKLVGLDADCGLDHQDNAEGMRMIARMKLKFCTYRSGTWQQRVIRSYEDCVLE